MSVSVRGQPPRHSRQLRGQPVPVGEGRGLRPRVGADEKESQPAPAYPRKRSGLRARRRSGRSRLMKMTFTLLRPGTLEIVE